LAKNPSLGKPKHATGVSLHPTTPAGKKRLARGLQRMVQAAAALAEPDAGLDHAACNAMLATYVDAEKHGEQAAVRFPRVWQHLQDCTDCHLSYTLLSDALGTESTAGANTLFEPATARDIPFLQTHSTDSPWTPFVSRTGPGAPVRFGFVVTRPVIASLFERNATIAMRGAEPTPPSLILSDFVSVGTREISIDVRAFPAETPDRLRLHVTCAPSDPFRMPVWVTLKWPGHRLVSALDDDRAVLPDILSADLAQATELHVEFDTEAE
jgi:hypothetical protein